MLAKVVLQLFMTVHMWFWPPGDQQSPNATSDSGALLPVLGLWDLSWEPSAYQPSVLTD